MTPLIPTALALLALAGPAMAASTPDENTAINTAQRFFDAMAANDGAAVTAITLPASVFTAIRPAPGGGTKVSRMTVEEFVKNLRPGLHEAMWAPRVSIRGGMMATVTAPYEFKLEGKSTHCGIDVFELAKVDGQWKVASLIWTAEPDACPELKTQKAAG
ncbi:MAG: hypothetical protein JHD15_01805 [Phenylobacterium sp.]|uniref:nuclear transport factor 2 family protein n=1 Tax=Phenylobacterium sp. TaxID=1871053 RepID=UPI001A25FA08|nr:nuclear transport factor 2 family protein [Phenylobacterium sp.]MBJ7409087.1 hypothetical protein [Phenylobacterium sp.]